MSQVTELVLLGEERRRLQEHVRAGLYPEQAPYVGAIQEAVVACARGDWEFWVELGGRRTLAAVVVAGLQLEEFVQVRASAWLN